MNIATYWLQRKPEVLLGVSWWLSWYLGGSWEQQLLQSCDQSRTSAGFSVFSEMSLALVFAGRTWAHDRSEHKLKIKLEVDPLLSLSAELRYISRHGHHPCVVIAQVGQCSLIHPDATGCHLHHRMDPEEHCVCTHNTQHAAPPCSLPTTGLLQSSIQL